MKTPGFIGNIVVSETFTGSMWLNVASLRGKGLLRSIDKRRIPMLLRKYMSLNGVGSAMIDLTLPKDHYRKGEKLSGKFHINGGIVDQLLTKIECQLVMIYENGKKEEIIDTRIVAITHALETEEEDMYSFVYQIPDDLPGEHAGARYLFRTKLKFEEGQDSVDEDYVTIQ